MSETIQNLKDYYSQRPHWKKIWQVSSGNVKDIIASDVERTLVENKQFLLDGILQYTADLDLDFENTHRTGKTTDKVPAPEKHQKLLSDKVDEETHLHKRNKFKKFMDRLSKYLKVSKRITWKILTSYIMYEYCGSLKSLEKLKYEMHILPMLSNIWKYYTSERMFSIKLLKTCLEFMDVKEHPYSGVYNRFVYSLGYQNIWRSLVAQYKFLLQEISSSSLDNDTPGKLWLERNIREQIELLHCLLILVDHVSITLTDFQEVMTMFKSHGFGSQPACYEALIIVQQSSFQKLKFAEVAVVLCMANNFWSETKNWYEETEQEKIDADMESLIRHDEFAPIVYIWIVMHMVLPNAIELFNNKYAKWTEKTLNLKVFSFFHQMIRHEMFADTSIVGVNVREAMYHLLLITCNKFNQGDSLLEHPGVLQLLAELLKTPQLAEQFFEQQPHGLMVMWSHTMHLLPYKFPTIAKLAEAIITSNREYVQNVMKELEVIPYYTMKASTRLNKASLPQHLQRYTVARRLSFSESTYTVEQCTTDMVCFKHHDVALVRFTREHNLFNELFEMLNHALVVGTDIGPMMNVLESGLMLTVALLRQEELALKQYPYLKNIIKACINMFVKCSGERDPPLKLLSYCLDILTEMLPNYRNELLSKLDTNKLLPSLPKNNLSNQYPIYQYRDMFRVDSMNSGIIGNLIIMHEKNPDQHYLVNAYLKFIRTSLHRAESDYSMELPSLIYFLKYIYLNFSCWYASNDIILKEMLYQCTHILYEMFQFTPELKSADPVRRTMHDITLQCLLDENWARILLKMLVSGSNNIQFLMENQTNWYCGHGVKYISTIQMILSLLLQILELRKQVQHTGPFPLENFIYSENHNLRVIKAVANLLNHPFNNSIPNLSCRLLKKFTVELDTSMLASLELEPDQVRLMFLQRLRDNLESEELKSAIIELVTASISCQPGMTEAFFTSIRTESEGTKSEQENQVALNESVGNFMVEYLNRATSDSVTFHSPLLYKIMELFHVLWMNQKEMLIKDLICDEQFWSSLCNPLFNEICFDSKMYAQIFNILSKEIHKQSGKISSTLQIVLNRFFAQEAGHIDIWIKHIFNEKNITQDLKIYPSLLNAWKNFIIVAVKLLPDNFFPVAYKVKITTVCRESLKNNVLLMEDNNAIIFCAELYLFLMTNWEDMYAEQHNSGGEIYGDIINLLHKVALSYGNLPKSLQETILAVTAVSFKSLKTNMPENFNAANTLVESIIQIFNFEYDALQECVKNKTLNTFDRKKHQGYFLCFSILKELLAARDSAVKANYMIWLKQSEIFRVILACAGIMSKHKATMPLAKDAIETLIFYVAQSDSVNFIDTDVALQLWEKFLPTKDFFKPPALGTVQPVPADLKEWWRIYKRLIIFLTVLLKKHRHLVLKEVVMFVSLHEDYVREILTLVVTSVDFNALDLVSVTLTLMYDLIQYRTFWKQEHEQSFCNIMEKIKMTLQCSAALIVRPNILKYFTINKSGHKAVLSDSVPTDNLVKLINTISNIVTLSASCILLVSPPLFPQTRDNRDYSYWELQMDPNFGLPKLGNSELTFGTLLCLSCLYVRILQQIILQNKNKGKEARSDENTEEKQSEYTPTSVDKLKGLVNKSNVSSASIGFIRLDYLNPLCNLSTVQNFSYSTSVTIFPWYAKLDEATISRALEVVLTLLASQVGPLLKFRKMEKHDKRMIRRELCSELQIFHDFVRKKLGDLNCYGKERGIFMRKKIKRTRVLTDAKNRSEEEALSDDERGKKNDKISRKRHVSGTSTDVDPEIIPEGFLNLLSKWFKFALKTDSK